MSRFFKRRGMTIGIMLALTFCILGACGSPAPVPITLTLTPVIGGATMALDSNPVTLKFSKVQRGKPPTALLMFNLTVRNDATTPRWFVFPSQLRAVPEAAPASGGVSDVQVYTYEGQGRVLVGNFLGTGGFRAMLLPPGADITFDNFGISYWGDVPEKFPPIEVVSASRLTVAGDPAENWFEGGALSDKKAHVALTQGKLVGTRHTSDGKEAPTTMADVQRYTVNANKD